MSSRRLADQVAWISGGGSGMGAATARLFAQEGACVVIADIAIEPAQVVADQINHGDRRALAIECEDSAGVTGTSDDDDGGYLSAAEWDSGVAPA